MLTRKPFGLFALLCTLLLSVAACAPQSSGQTNSPKQTVLPGTSLYVLDGAASPLANSSAMHIVGFYPQGNTASVTLPAGLISQDHERIFTAVPQNGKTSLVVTNTQNGSSTTALTIPGTYTTEGAYYTNSVLSPDSHWLGLRQVEQAGATTNTTIVLIDTQAAKLVQTIHLKGRFDLDAISNNGFYVYLLERLNANGDYNVRLYQVEQNKLFEAPVVDKSAVDEKMVGVPLTRQVSPGGNAVFTLYTQPARNMAFVHILPLEGDPIARCIDLPSGNSPELLKYYNLTLAPDGHTLYAVNSALGTVSVIKVTDDIVATGDAVTTRFTASATSMTSQDHSYELFNGAAVSPDGKTLYVVGMRGIQALNTAGFQLRSTYLAQQALTGLALSSNGQTLYAVSPESGVTQIDLNTGKTQQITQSSLHAPWGVEWIGGA